MTATFDIAGKTAELADLLRSAKAVAASVVSDGDRRAVVAGAAAAAGLTADSVWTAFSSQKSGVVVLPPGTDLRGRKLLDREMTPDELAQIVGQLLAEIDPVAEEALWERSLNDPNPVPFESVLADLEASAGV